MTDSSCHCAFAPQFTRLPTTVGTSIVLVGSLLTGGSGAVFADEAVIVGGGYEVHRSEAQIELNVKWVQAVLENAGLPVTTFFTDGAASGADVFEFAPDATIGEVAPGGIEALTRVFDDVSVERRRYRENSIPEIAGSTARESLAPALQSLLARDDQPTLFVYMGHGSQSADSPDGVSLELWNSGRLEAQELHALLAGRSQPFRWVFTQCYSGGFHRLAFADPARGTALADGGARCGFTAESAYRPAEGCSASIDIGDYRDYSTFFFAALAGEQRDGSVLASEPDLDADGHTTPREAHLHTLRHAFSSDLSRSTSEEWLDEWQPWHLRWLPSPRNLPDNEYARLYRDLAAGLGIALDARTPRRARDETARQTRRVQEILAERRVLRDREGALRDNIAADVLATWPGLYGPWTSAYVDLVKSGEIERVAEAIAARGDYAELVALQREDDALDAALIEAERLGVQYLKLLRFRRLSMLLGQLEQWGNNEDRARYESLVSCEEMPLAGG